MLQRHAKGCPVRARAVARNVAQFVQPAYWKGAWHLARELTWARTARKSTGHRLPLAALCGPGGSCRGDRAQPTRALLVDDRGPEGRRGARAVSTRTPVAEEMAYVLEHCLCPVSCVLRATRNRSTRYRGAGPRAADRAHQSTRTRAACGNTTTPKLHALADVQAEGRAAHERFEKELKTREAELDFELDLRDALYLGHDGQAQGRGPVEPQHHQ